MLSFQPVVSFKTATTDILSPAAERASLSSRPTS